MDVRKLTAVILGCVCLAGLTQVVWAQQGSALGASRDVLRTPPRPVEDAEVLAATAATFGGKLVFSITITIASSIPTSNPIGCEATATIDDVGSAGAGPLIEEFAAVAASRSGSTATCTVTIPYSWTLLNGSTDTVQLSYVVSSPVTAFVGGSSGLPARVHSQTIGSIKVPLNGATTTETIKATI